MVRGETVAPVGVGGREHLRVITRLETQPEGRRFERHLSMLVVAVLVLLSLSTLLSSHRGRRLFADDESVIDLLGDLRESSDGAFEILGSAGGNTRLDLATVDLEPRARYLMVFRAGAGGAVVVAVRGAGRGPAATWGFGSRKWRREYHRFLESAALPDPARILLVYKGRGDIVVEELSLRRMSSAYEPVRYSLRMLIGLLIAAFIWRHRRFLRSGIGSPTGSIDRFFALLVFSTCLFVFLAAPVRQVVDSRYMSVVSHSIIHSGEVALPERFAPARISRLPYQLVRIDGRTLHFYSPAPAILNVPLVFAYEIFGQSPIRDGRHYDRWAEGRILGMGAALVTAMLCVLFYILARHFLQPLVSLALALVFAFGTPVLSTLSRPYWSHTWASLLLGGAILLVLFPRPGRERIGMVMGATMVSWAFFCRPQMALSVIAVTALHLLLHRGRWLLPFIVTGVFWAAAGALFFQLTVGQVVPDYFFSSQIHRLDLGTRSLAQRYVQGFLGSLWSPSRGLLATSPFLIWGLWVVGRSRRQLESRIVAGVAVSVIMSHFLMLIHTRVWPGGLSFGARQWSDVIVWFFLLGVLATAAYVAAPRPRRSLQKTVSLSLLAVLIAASLFINGRGAYSWDTWNWKAFDRRSPWEASSRPWYLSPGSAWNYRYPQYLAGILPKDRAVPVGDDDGE